MPLWQITYHAGTFDVIRRRRLTTKRVIRHKWTSRPNILCPRAPARMNIDRDLRLLPQAGEDRDQTVDREAAERELLESLTAHSAFEIGLPLPDSCPDLVLHAVVRQGQHDKGLFDDSRDDQMARAADLARNPRNAAPAVSKVIVDAASDNRDAGTAWVVEQIHQGLLNQNLISLSPESAELDRAPPQDFVQLALRGRGEQDIA